jgi:hypothetical protein
MAVEFSGDMSEPLVVLRYRIGHDVAVLRSRHDALRPQRQAADDDEVDFRLYEAEEKLIE